MCMCFIVCVYTHMHATDQYVSVVNLRVVLSGGAPQQRDLYSRFTEPHICTQIYILWVDITGQCV